MSDPEKEASAGARRLLERVVREPGLLLFDEPASALVVTHEPRALLAKVL
ncbi:hypothetical protein ACFV2N_13255 [Streptomyces sp. NPDC059680]